MRITNIITVALLATAATISLAATNPKRHDTLNCRNPRHIHEIVPSSRPDAFYKTCRIKATGELYSIAISTRTSKGDWTVTEYIYTK